MRTTQQIFARTLHQLELIRIGAQESSQSDPPSITQQSSDSLAKQKRNQKTPLQYKKRSLHVNTVQIHEVNHIQEVDHNQEVEHSLGARNKPGKHVVVQSLKLGAWECCWHTVLQSDWMTMVARMTIGYGANGIRRLGVG